MELYFANEPRIPVNNRSLRAALNLTGDAAIWLQMQSYDLPNLEWGQLANALRLQYRPVDWGVRARDALDRCVQTGAVSGYSTAYRKCLVRCADVSPRESLWRYVAGLRNEPRAWVRMHNPSTLLEAMQIAERYERSFMV